MATYELMQSYVGRHVPLFSFYWNQWRTHKLHESNVGCKGSWYTYNSCHYLSMRTPLHLAHGCAMISRCGFLTGPEGPTCYSCRVTCHARYNIYIVTMYPWFFSLLMTYQLPICQKPLRFSTQSSWHRSPVCLFYHLSRTHTRIRAKCARFPLLSTITVTIT